MISSCIMCILLLCLSNFTLSDTIWVTILFGSLFLLFGYIIFMRLNTKFELCNKEMVYTNFIGISMKYNYIDIEKIVFHYYKNTNRLEKIAIYCKRRKIVAECTLIDFDEMARILRRKIKVNKNCIIIEKNKKMK